MITILRMDYYLRLLSGYLKLSGTLWLVAFFFFFEKMVILGCNETTKAYHQGHLDSVLFVLLTKKV